MSAQTLAGWRVGVTADRRADDQLDLLRRKGAEVLHGPTMRIVPLSNDARLASVTRELLADPPAVVVACPPAVSVVASSVVAARSVAAPLAKPVPSRSDVPDAVSASVDPELAVATSTAAPLPVVLVDDIDAVRAELIERGLAITEVQQLGPEGSPGSRFAFFADPDGNGWSVQEIKR